MKLRGVLAFAVLFVLLGSVGFGQGTDLKCTPQNVLVNAAEFQPVDPPEGTDYVLCGTIPVRGTLNGTYFTCFVADPLGIDGLPIFPLGSDPDAYSAYYAEWIETRKGRLQLDSIGVGYFSSGLQAGLSKILPDGSTGAYAGATGYLSLMPEWQTFGPATGTWPTVARLSGYVCTP